MGLEEDITRESGQSFFFRHKRLVFVVIGIVALSFSVLAVLGKIAEKRSANEPEDYSQTGAESLIQFIQADFVDLSYIYSISKFRSGSGHDFSGNGETCRSMKHYFNVQWTEEGERERQENNGLPKPPSLGRGIAIYSPVDGEIVSVEEEQTPIGKQVYIRPDSAPKYTVRLFHIYLLSGFEKGRKVKAGEKIGEIGLHQNTDIAITRGSKWSEELVSYFEVMPDSIFAKYEERGLKERGQLIISREERDKNPLQCSGEQFAVKYDEIEPAKHFVYLSGYLDSQKVGEEEKKAEQAKSVASQTNSTPANSNQTSPSSGLATPEPSAAPAQSPPSQAGTPPAALAKLAYGAIIAPYVNESDIISVNEAFSLDANNPYWGFWHPGVDFMVEKDIDVQASYGGTIENLAVEENAGQMGWHAGFCINNGTENGICYNLETFSHETSVHDSLVAGLKISNGSQVNKGDIIGRLIYGGSGAHIDFGVTAPGTRVCPEPYFTAEAKESVLRLIHKTQPTWPMCY